MAEGLRDAFIEDDVIGNYNVGTSFLGGFKARNSRRKARKRRKKGIRKMQRRRRHKRHRKSHKRKAIRGGIRYTKNGQPYKILANGRARFIKGRRRK